VKGEAILVTGAAGLIGRAVTRRLRDQGRRVTGLDIVARPGQADVEHADLTDIHRLHALARKGAFGAIVHCGAVSGPMVMTDNPFGIVQANVVGSANIFELARIYGVRRVVFCSSASAYGPTLPPGGPVGVTEDTPLRPSSVYGATKVACEALVQGYRTQHRLDAVSIRLSWVYGPGRTTDCVVRAMIENTQAGRPTRLPFGQDFPRQYIYVDDAVDALLAALDAPRCPSPVYNATGGVTVTLGELGALVTKVLGKGDIWAAPGPDPLDDYQHSMDITAIERDLGFAPKVGLPEGVARYAGWLTAQGEVKL
jgi:UDP-glucuronate 4-epimerase